MKYDIFISYKRLGVSSAIAAYFYDLLSRKGYHVFFDRKEIRQGRFNEQLFTHIENAQDFILLLEPSSLNSCFNGISGSYKTDWFCMEVMHALKNKKRIIPILLDGYTMPNIQDLPTEIKPLALENAISFDASDIEDFYKKYFIDQGYLLSKPKDLYKSQLNGEGVADFLFYSEGNCDIFEYGNLIGSLDHNIDENHPYLYTVKRAGEHRFECINNDTCEKSSFIVTIEKDTQKYVLIPWKLTQKLWELTVEDIENLEDSKTLFFWGKGLFEGTSLHEPNIGLAFKCLEKAARLWSLDAKNYIIDNVVTIVNNNSATEFRISWLTLASEFGSAMAQNVLGDLYLNGDGVERNGIMAMKYFLLASKQNYEDAMHRIGWMYTEGIGVRRNYTKGRQWYEKCVAIGSIKSMLCLGEIYLHGRGVKKDYDKALATYRKVEEKEPSKALLFIGIVYFLQENYNKAFEYIKKAADQDDMTEPIAKTIVSIMLNKGMGTFIDNEASKQYLLKVDEIAKTVKSMYGFYNSLAWNLYLIGIYEEALSFAIKSVELKEEAANLDTLAAIYRALGDYNNAIYYYEKCVALGKYSANQDIESIKKKNKKRPAKKTNK